MLSPQEVGEVVPLAERRPRSAGRAVGDRERGEAAAPVGRGRGQRLVALQDARVAQRSGGLRVVDLPDERRGALVAGLVDGQRANVAQAVGHAGRVPAAGVRHRAVVAHLRPRAGTSRRGLKAHALDAALRARGRLQGDRAAQRRAGVGDRDGDGIEVGRGREGVARRLRVAGEVGAGAAHATEGDGPEPEPQQRHALHAAPSIARRWASMPSWRHRRARLKAAIRSAGSAIASMRTFLMPSAESA